MLPLKAPSYFLFELLEVSIILSNVFLTIPRIEQDSIVDFISLLMFAYDV